ITHTTAVGADILLIIFVGMFLFYVMLFILPEQLVILYCKFRFNSFNYYTKYSFNKTSGKGSGNMAIERRPLVFDHVLTYRTEQRKTDWQEPLGLLESFVLDKGVYKNGPAFFTFVPEPEDESDRKSVV